MAFDTISLKFLSVNINSALLKELRVRESLTQEKLAEKAGIHLRTLQRIEQRGVASLRSRKAIALALDIDPADLNANNQTNNHHCEVKAPRQLPLRYVKAFVNYKTLSLLAVIILVTIRVLSHIPIPGISPIYAFAETSVGMLTFPLNFLSSGGYGRMSVLALGILPYCLSVLALRLFVYLRHRLNLRRVDHERVLTSKNTFYLTSGFAITFSLILTNLEFSKVAYLPNINFYIGTITWLTLAASLLAWLGETAFRRGVNGLYLLIGLCLVSQLPSLLA